jgi:murein DD-endopeptidase MepM/ murein hydrolase activator NlpD
VSVDWRTKRPLLIRATAHFTIIILTLVTIVVGGAGITVPQIVAGSSLSASSLAIADADAASGVGGAGSPTPSGLLNGARTLNADTVSRLPVPHTDLPERIRPAVRTYIVQPGDSVYGIAAKFGLSPDTIAWSNREALMDAPWLIKPGLALYILPVDGVYHTTRAGDTVSSIASQYGVESVALYNEWNGLGEGEQPSEGRLLVVPGARGPEVEWEPPPPPPSLPGPAQFSYGVCGGAQHTGPGANGWFLLPTGSTDVSGWYFNDPRNPTHIGLDYRCRTGDPIYAADSGVVTIAGWNGGYGIMVELDHGNGFRTRYAHFMVGGLTVGCGHAVHQGDVIGHCGSTGWSSGAHLHFEIRNNGVPVDPMLYQ